MADPWASRNIHLLPMEHCVRLRYNPNTQEWITDDGVCTGMFIGRRSAEAELQHAKYPLV